MKLDDLISAERAIQKQHPQQQGLKHSSGVGWNTMELNSKATSTTTRIETQGRPVAEFYPWEFKSNIHNNKD